MTAPHTIAWLMRASGCDGSADWIEPGASEPEPMAGFEAVPLGDVREMQAEAERLRDALQRERACSGRYMEERNQARLQAQREVGEEVRKLRAELERARRDSVHYRWLIEQHWIQAEAEFRMSLPDGDTLEDFERDLGAAIDAAIAAKREWVDASRAKGGAA